MKDHTEAMMACSVAAKIEVAGRDMNVDLMLVHICIQNILKTSVAAPLR